MLANRDRYIIPLRQLVGKTVITLTRFSSLRGFVYSLCSRVLYEGERITAWRLSTSTHLPRHVVVLGLPPTLPPPPLIAKRDNVIPANGAVEFVT